MSEYVWNPMVEVESSSGVREVSLLTKHLMNRNVFLAGEICMEQARGSYIISDPKGNLCKKYRRYLEAKGYVVRKLDFVHPERSAHYNFFRYIHSEKDILKIAHMLVYRSETQNAKVDPIWDQTAELLLTAIIGYLYYHRPRSEQNLANILKLVTACEIDENNSERKSGLDFIMDEVGRRDCGDFPKMIASIRSRGISVMLMIQAESQLAAAYGEDGKTIIGNCDTYVYLGGNDVETAKSVALRCDLPVKKILEMPVGSNWIFRRGQKATNGVNFDLDSFWSEKKKELDAQNEMKIA